VNRRDIIERLLAYFGVGGGVGFGLKIIDKNDTLPIVRRIESNDFTLDLALEELVCVLPTKTLLFLSITNSRESDI
jgi:hypothetical protein